MTPRRNAGRRGLLPAQHVDLPAVHTLQAVRSELVPQSYDTSHAFTGWGMVGNGPDPTLTINDGQPVGDCFFAAVAHGLMNKALVQSNGGYALDPELVPVIQPTADHWVGLYLGYQNELSPGKTATSGPDNGTEPVAGFKWLTAAGIIKRWGLVAPSKLNEATYDHNGVLLACALDADAEQEFEHHQPWRNLPASVDPIEGGHAIYRVGFTPRYGTEITWAEDQQAARAWENNHVQQAFWFQASWEADAAGYEFGEYDRALAAV